jgi:hypothetical protein
MASPRNSNSNNNRTARAAMRIHSSSSTLLRRPLRLTGATCNNHNKLPATLPSKLTLLKRSRSNFHPLKFPPSPAINRSRSLKFKSRNIAKYRPRREALPSRLKSLPVPGGICLWRRSTKT